MSTRRTTPDVIARALVLLATLGLAACQTASMPGAATTTTPPASPTPEMPTPTPDPTSTPLDALIDATTLHHKVMFGYQGWFACEGDGAPVGGWVHWFRDNTPDAAHATVDLLPDVSELPAEERCATAMTKADGSPVELYSAWRAPTVDRHFRWMEDYGIDGVFLQRFASELPDERFLAMRDQVTRNVRAGAEAHGRVFAIEYDISGMNPTTLVADIENDWMHLVDELLVTESDRYLRDGDRPVLAIWGFGFPDRPGTPDQARALIEWLRTGAPERYRAALIGGVPWWWRDDANTQWADVYRSWDVITPWAVGAWNDDAGADGYRNTRILPDLADAASHGRRFMPTVWPGFTWKNLNGGASNAIPRRAGRHFWRAAYGAMSAGSSMMFVAMFDEVDEGTAMMKIAPRSDLPAQGTFVGVDADGETLPPDFYLRLGGRTSRAMRGEIPLTPDVPQ